MPYNLGWTEYQVAGVISSSATAAQGNVILGTALLI
jgi:hypothetical protein